MKIVNWKFKGEILLTNKSNKLSLLIFLTILSNFLLIKPVFAAYQTWQEAFSTIFSFAIDFAGVILIIVFLVGGFMYLLSAGNEETANRAKKILLYGVIGLVIVVMSYSMAKFFAGNLGLNISVFPAVKSGGSSSQSQNTTGATTTSQGDESNTSQSNSTTPYDSSEEGPEIPGPVPTTVEEPTSEEPAPVEEPTQTNNISATDSAIESLIKLECPTVKRSEWVKENPDTIFNGHIPEFGWFGDFKVKIESASNNTIVFQQTSLQELKNKPNTDKYMCLMVTDITNSDPFKQRRMKFFISNSDPVFSCDEVIPRDY